MDQWGTQGFYMVDRPYFHNKFAVRTEKYLCIDCMWMDEMKRPRVGGMRIPLQEKI